MIPLVPSLLLLLPGCSRVCGEYVFYNYDLSGDPIGDGAWEECGNLADTSGAAFPSDDRHIISFGYTTDTPDEWTEVDDLLPVPTVHLRYDDLAAGNRLSFEDAELRGDYLYWDSGQGQFETMPLVEGWIEIVKGPAKKNLGTTEDNYLIAWDLRWDGAGGACEATGEDWVRMEESWRDYEPPGTGDFPQE